MTVDPAITTAIAALRCSHCLLPLREPRFHVHVIGRALYHQHCATTLAGTRAEIVAVPLAVAHALVNAPCPWRLLECGFRLEWRDAWWGMFWNRSDVRLTIYVCLLPFVPLRLVLGPRLRGGAGVSEARS